VDKHQERIEAAYHSECSPQAAYDWLYEQRQLTRILAAPGTPLGVIGPRLQ